MKRIVFILVLLGLGFLSYGQQIDKPNQLDPDSDNINQSAGRDTTTIVDNTFFDIFYGKPGKAAFYGLIIPGGGQVYNKRWWKLPFVYGLEGFLIYSIFKSTSNFNEYDDAYLFNLRNPDSLELMDVGGVTSTSILKTQRDKFRRQREYSWVFFIGGHLITIFEAFIDRHLMEFDISDDLTFSPIMTGIGPVNGITYTIPLNKDKKVEIKNVLTSSNSIE